MSPCDLNLDGQVNVLDVQIVAMQAVQGCGTADLNHDGRCDQADQQIVINAALGGACLANAAAASSPPGAPSSVPGAATFVQADTRTSGNWKGTYGAEGYVVTGDTTQYPGYAGVTPTGNSLYIWANSTTDVRALQKAASSTDRIAACWTSDTTLTLDVNLSDGNSHQVALYLLDWSGYGGGRTERVDVLDTSGTVLDTQSVAGFGSGIYLVWNLKGHVTIRITNTNSSSNAVISGLFFK
jgi:hypothetical protein